MNANEIKAVRLGLKRTRKSIAKVVGTTETTWYRWETGRSSPMPVFVERIEKLKVYLEKLQGEGKL